MKTKFDSTEKEAVFYDVYLDGERQDFCKKANVVEGWVDVYELKPHDNTFEVILDKEGHPKVTRKSGKVELIYNKLDFII